MTQTGEASHPMCTICGGACCEAITLDITPFAQSADFMRFIEFRSVPQAREIEGKQVTNFRLFETKCLMLKDGRCSVYEQRPKMCDAFKPGSQNCISTFTARRDPEIVAQILKCADGAVTPPRAE